MRNILTICVTGNLKQKGNSLSNDLLTLEQVKQLCSEDPLMPLVVKMSMSQNGECRDELIKKRKQNSRNIVQGIGYSLEEAKENWNHLYFLDYDITQWTAGEQGMHDCIAELRDAFPNHLIIKPSNRFGIHVVLSSESETYNGPEHLYYGIMGHRIVERYKPIFKEEELHKQIMDEHYFNNLTQRMNLNTLTFLDDECYLTSDFAIYNPNPQPFPRIITGFDDYATELTNEEKPVINYYANRMYGSRKELKTEKPRASTANTIVREGNAFNINKELRIPGVPYTGNDLRWRIVAILYAKMGYEETKNIIPQKFVQAKEMLAALETINRSQTAIYEVKNYLIEMFVDREVLNEKASSDADSLSIEMSEGEYLSDYLDTIKQKLQQSSIYLVSPQGTGKTEFIKKEFYRENKCVILVHQKSILESKFKSDPAYAPYIIRTEDVKRMGPTPDKVICIWDTFAKMARERDFSNHFILLDESHNLITQLGFRPVIFDVLESLKNNHQLWMTGTPCGEEVLMSEHTRLVFKKKSTTHYNVYPIQLATDKHNEYVSYVCDFIDKLLPKCEQSTKKLVAIYDNRDHNRWQERYGKDSVHYVSIYKDTEDVQEINQKAKTSKSLINSTSYLGEGVDIKGYEEVYTIIPVNRFVSEVNILQFVKRFRDARIVNIYLIQYTQHLDFNNMPYAESEKKPLSEYIQSFSFQTVRNPVHDRRLKLEKLELKHLKLIATDNKFQDLYDAFYEFMTKPFNIYMAHYLKDEYSFDVKPIKYEQPPSIDIQVPSRENPTLKEYVSKNYERLAYMIDESDGYDEVIYQIEEELGNGEVPFRTELRHILTIIRKVNEMHCLKDCVEYFTNKNGDIQWQKISRLCDDIQLQQDILDGKVTMDSNIKSCKDSAQKKIKSIERSVDLLKFRLQKGESVATQVDKYRDRERSKMSPKELLFDFYDKDISVFVGKTPNRTRKKKSIVIRSKKTAESHSFESCKECMIYLNVTKPTFNKAISKGATKLNREWDFIVDGRGLTITDSSLFV